MVRKTNLKAFVYGCGVALCSLLGSCAGPLDTADAKPTSIRGQRLVSLSFSAGAWGGLPFTEDEERHVIVAAMLSGERARLEREVAHLLRTPGARVRRFAAVYEVDGSVRPPRLRSGYELELLAPYGEDSLTVELVNGETGVVNIVRVATDGY